MYSHFTKQSQNLTLNISLNPEMMAYGIRQMKRLHMPRELTLI